MKCVIAFISLALCSFATAETVGEMIVRQTFIDKTYTPKIEQSFVAVAGTHSNLTLQVIQQDRLHFSTDRFIVTSQSLEILDEVQRQFVIAHELGHVVLQHTKKKIELFSRSIPGQIKDQAQLDAVRAAPEMRELLHSCELEADTFAMARLMGLGWTKDQVIAGFMGLGRYAQTETHPSSFARITNLRNFK